MAEFRIVLNHAGIGQILKSEGVRADLHRRAERIAAAAKANSSEPDAVFEADSQVGPRRARAEVRCDNIEARVAEARDRALTRAIDAGRG